MNVLAFDTCFGALSVAVRWRDGNGDWQLHEAYETRTTGHAERLFPMIAEVLTSSGLGLPAVERIAVTLGPGTFTGVRVGIAAARGFAVAMSKPVAGITSLAAMAHRANALIGQSRACRPLAVAMDARRGMIYLQVFRDDIPGAEAPRLATPEDAARIIGDQPAVIVGSGAAAVAAFAGPSAEARLPDLQPHARSLAELAADLTPMSPVSPVYLREPDVKPQADKALLRSVP